MQNPRGGAPPIISIGKARRTNGQRPVPWTVHCYADRSKLPTVSALGWGLRQPVLFAELLGNLFANWGELQVENA